MAAARRPPRPEVTDMVRAAAASRPGWAAALLLALGACASDPEPRRIEPARDLKDPNAAVRQKAATVASRSGDWAFVPDLIEMLDDPDPGVRLVAGAGLAEITGRDTGYRAYAEPSQRREQVESWRAWYTARSPGSTAGRSPR
jgi:HEAT repeat protein